MELRAFAICRTCSELFPSAGSCPACDGAAFENRSAAPEVFVVSQPVEYGADDFELIENIELGRSYWKPLAMVLSLSAVVSTLVVVALKAA